MKYLLTLLLLPMAAQGQSIEKKPLTSGKELGFNLGHAFDNAYFDQLQHGGYIRSSVALLKRSGNMQYGVTVEGGTNSDDYWYLSPGFLMNRTFSSRRAYYYAGAMAGYVISSAMGLGDVYPEQKYTQGYVFGLQGGLVQPVSKRLSFASELALRSTQVWKPRYFDREDYETDVILYFPVTVGFRYRL